MGRTLLLLLLLACGWTADAGADEEKEPPSAERIDDAVARGVAWLRARQQKDGSFGTDFDDGSPSGQPEGYAGHKLGRLALALYTLVHCGMGERDLAVRRGLRILRSQYKTMLKKDAPPGEGPTYTVALILILLHELYATAPLEFDADGKPRNERVKPTKTNPLGIPAWAHRMTTDCMKWFTKVRARNGLYGYPTPMPKPPRGQRVPKALIAWMKKHGGTDNSNTQFALLGLWAGTRLGYRLEAKFLTSLAKAVAASQSPKGPVVRRTWDPEEGGNPNDARYAGPQDEARGFSYTPMAPRFLPSGKQVAPMVPVETGSMTAGGLSSLLIAKAMLTEADALTPKLETLLDEGIWDAVAWLASNFRVDGNPHAWNRHHLPEAERKGPNPKTSFASIWPLYYLYGLERACVIANKRFLGGRDWYAEGAAVVLRWQEKSGRFHPSVDAPARPGFIPSAAGWMQLPNTCFALLFLQRATLRPRKPLVQTTKPAEEK